MKRHRKINPRLTVVLLLAVVAAVVVGARKCTHSPLASAADSIMIQPRLNDSLNNENTLCELSGKIDSTLNKYLKRWEINGAQLVITRNDSLVYCHGYGWADKERGIEMQPTYLMRLASVSKLVTAVGIMKLCEMGKLHLTDHVFGEKGVLNDTAYTNRIKDKRYFDITVEHLLRHCGGFTNYAGDPMFSTRYIMMQNHLTTPPDNHELMKILLKRRLGVTPGTAFHYSNVGYTLLSMIIEKRSGQSYEDFMQENVLLPAGCFDFHIAGNYYQDRLPNETKYYMHHGSEPVYEFNNSGRKVAKCYGENDIPRLSGAGAWCASAVELSRLVAAIDLCPTRPDIISKESIRQMTTERPDHGFSLGWNFTPVNRPWVRTGSLSGTSALVVKYPDNECWILITNTSTWKGHGFSNDTMALFDKLRQKYSSKLPRRDLFG